MKGREKGGEGRVKWYGEGKEREAEVCCQVRESTQLISGQSVRCRVSLHLHTIRLQYVLGILFYCYTKPTVITRSVRLLVL